MGWKNVVGKDISEMGTTWKDVKDEALNLFCRRKRVLRCIGLRGLGAVVSCC